MSTIQATFELNLLIVPDKKTGMFTAFFAQFPEVIACDSTEEDAQSRLINLFKVMLNDRKTEIFKKEIDEGDYINKPINLVFA